MIYRFSIVFVFAFIVSGCANINLHEDANTSRGMTFGSLGAIGGGAIAALAGGDLKAIAASAIGTGVVSGAVGVAMDNQEKELRQRLSGSGVHIERVDDGHIVVMAPGKILFDVGRSSLNGDTFEALDSVAEVFEQYDDQVMIVAGHTDSTGSRSVNQPLSEDRAHSAAQYLISQGVDRQVVQTQGFADSTPIANNDSERGRAMNRRVTFHIVHAG